MAAYLQMLTVLTACAALLASSYAQKAPRFKACKRDQPTDKLNECVKDSLQKAIPELVKGLPEFGLLSIDPLRVESLEVAKSNNQKKAVSVDISFKNLDIMGLRNAKIKSVDVDVNNYKMKASLDIPGTITLQGDYTIKGKVLVLPIQGSGRCNITLGDNMNAVLNDNWKEIYQDMKDPVEAALSFACKNIADRVFTKVPYNKVFP